MNKIKNSYFSIIVLFVLLSCGTFPSNLIAQNTNDSIVKQSWQKFRFELGGYLANTSSSLRLNRSGSGIGVDVDVEDALGLNTTSITGMFTFNYRFSQTNRHALHLSVFQLTRTATKILENDLEIGDNYYPAGSSLSTRFALNVSKLSYRYSLIHDERLDLYLAGGLYIMPMDLKVERRVIEFDEKQLADLVAPLPVIGVGSSVYLTKKWMLKNDMNFFYLELDSYKGNMIDINLLLEYYILNNFGLGLGYNSFNIDVKARDKDAGLGLGFDGDIAYHLSGIVFFAHYSF